jgi:hypothetical protein
MFHVAWYTVEKFILALVWNQYEHWLWRHWGREAHVKKLCINRNAINLVRYKKCFASSHRNERGTYEVLHYKPEGCGFDCQWRYWNSSLTYTFRPHCGLESNHLVKEISTRNISWGSNGGRCVGLTTFPPSCADCLELLGASTFWSTNGLSRPFYR